MRPILALSLFSLLALSLTSAGCVQVQQGQGSCGDGALGMSYVEHTYLWGNENFFTKRYDVSVYTIGFPSVKNDISRFEFDTYKQTYCSPSTSRAQPTSTTPVITKITTINTPAPTHIPIKQRKITDGFWCRDTTINIGTAPTEITECYQFFSDGTYKWGYYPGWAMGKSLSCSGSPDAKCVYSFNSKGKYEVQGGYSYSLSGDFLIDPHDPPYFAWSPTGIP